MHLRPRHVHGQEFWGFFGGWGYGTFLELAFQATIAVCIDMMQRMQRGWALNMLMRAFLYAIPLAALRAAVAALAIATLSAPAQAYTRDIGANDRA